MATLTKPQLDQIRAALLPLLQTQETREALVRAALWAKPVLNRIRWEGTASIFALHLADVLDNADLADVLKEAGTQVGTAGQAKLVRLADEVTSPVAPPEDTPTDAPVDRTKLRDALINLFSMPDLEMLCFDLGIDADAIGGHNATKQAFALGIIQWFGNRKRLAELVVYVRQQRGHAEL